jgi:hypothetical protein
MSADSPTWTGQRREKSWQLGKGLGALGNQTQRSHALCRRLSFGHDTACILGKRTYIGDAHAYASYGTLSHREAASPVLYCGVPTRADRVMMLC